MGQVTILSVTDRYVRECLPEKYKDPDQIVRAKTRGSGSAGTKQILAEKTKRERAEDSKGAANYKIEEIDGVTNIEIVKDIARYHFKRVDYYKSLLNAFNEYAHKALPDKATKKQREEAETEFTETL
jgi:hypothetical protein